MSGASSARHVKVVVRTKPTAAFAHDQILLDRDGKVHVCTCYSSVFKYLCNSTKRIEHTASDTSDVLWYTNDITTCMCTVDCRHSSWEE